jgi:hypothetical protein
MMTNSRLVKLALAGNAIGDDGCEAIMLGLMKNKVPPFV